MADVPLIAGVLAGVLLIAGSALNLIGTIGLLRLRSFVERMHAPTLGTTLGMFCVAAASMIYFSVTQGRPVLHEALIVVFVTTTAPISLIVLLRAALLRDHFKENRAGSAADADQT
jgi:multicomponent K+:H+ antiporter subunit G